MVNKLNYLIFIILCGISQFVTAGITASASVDRSVISINDSLQLTIAINDTGTYKTPDLTALEHDFEIAGTSQSSRHSIINGHSESETTWRISLYPKHEGTLLIPAIKINDAKTQPISISVKKASAINQDQLDTVFLQTNLSDSEAFVDQEVIFTLQVFHSVQLDNLSISELAIDNANVKKIGKNSFNRNINGLTHRVHEITYAIYPKVAGTLIIPEQTFSAAMLSRNSRFYSMNSETIRRRSQPLTISVKPIPTDYKDRHWLPAKNLILDQTWSSDPKQLRVGDSITRTITTSAEGIQASILPPIQFDAIEGAKLYPDQGQINNTETPQGIKASRTDSTALIATKAGTLRIPAITIHWWDTEARRMKTATIKEQILNVLPALEKPNTQNYRVDNTVVEQPISNTTVVDDKAVGFWKLYGIAMTVCWLITTAILLIKNRSTSLASKSPPINNKQLSEKSAYKQLAQVCHDNKIDELRPTLLQWARIFWLDDTINHFDELNNRANNPTLKTLLLQFDNKLYGNQPDSSAFNTEALLVVINNIRQQHPNKQHPENLQPLYK